MSYQLDIIREEIPLIEKDPDPKKIGYWRVRDHGDRVWVDEINIQKQIYMQFKKHKETAQKHGIGGSWMTLEKGDNKVRIVSEFFDYGSHYDNNKKESVICLGKEECLICKSNEDLPEKDQIKTRVQFLGWIIDRADGGVKLLRIGYSIVKQIGEYANNDEYAFDDVPPYDITIKKEGEGLDTVYTVIPARKNIELTKKEKEDVAKLDSPKEILEGMRAKVVSRLISSDEETVEEPEEKTSKKTEKSDEIDVKDIPF